MGRKSGMHSPLGRRACEQWADPLRPGPPVLCGSPVQLQLVDSNPDTESPLAPCEPSAGVIRSGRFTIEVTVGTGGFGFFKYNTSITGFDNVFDISYSTGTYAGASYTNTVGAGVAFSSLAEMGLSSNGNGISAYTLGAKFTLRANEEIVAARGGSVAIWETDNVAAVTGPDYNSLIREPFVQTYPGGIFDENDALVLRPTPRRYSVQNVGVTPGDSNTAEGYQCGFFFKSNPGQSYLMEVEYAVFYWGSTVPRTIDPIMSSAAYDCVASCVYALKNEQIGTTERENGRQVSKLLKHAEHHTVSSTPSPITSAVWPVIKQAAYALGPELMKLIGSFM